MGWPLRPSVRGPGANEAFCETARGARSTLAMEHRPAFETRSLKFDRQKGSSIESRGGRDRDRTCDPYHVKVVLYR